MSQITSKNYIQSTLPAGRLLFHGTSSAVVYLCLFFFFFLLCLNRSQMTQQGVTRRGRTPTRSSLTTTILSLILTLSPTLTLTPSLSLTATTADTTACSRTSLARADQPWWHQKIRAVCVEISNRPFFVAFLPALCCHQWKATAKVEHQTRAANKGTCTYKVCRHKSDTAFCFCFFFLSGWDPSLDFFPASREKSGTFRNRLLVHDH